MLNKQSLHNNHILIIAGGKKRKLNAFLDPIKKLNLDVTLASFSELNYSSDSPYQLKVASQNVTNFNLIYIRVVGTRLEDATLLVNYAKEHSIKVIDSVYETSNLMPSSLGKSLETSKLIKAGIPMPKTYFGSLGKILRKGEAEFGFPFVIKSTTGKRAQEVWSPKDKAELKELLVVLKKNEQDLHMRFFVQEFIPASQRIRVFVIGNKAIAAITRPTKWRRRFIEKVGENYPEGDKKAIIPVPREDEELALHAAKAANLEIAGVDIVHADTTGQAYVLEANAAPSWELVKKDTNINVEEVILKYLLSNL